MNQKPIRTGSTNKIGMPKKGTSAAIGTVMASATPSTVSRIRRDLGGVPGAAALGADPSLAVRRVADIAAVAADGDLGAAHARILGAGQGPEQAGRPGVWSKEDIANP